MNQNAGYNCNQLKVHCKGSLKIIAQESVILRPTGRLDVIKGVNYHTKELAFSSSGFQAFLAVECNPYSACLSFPTVVGGMGVSFSMTSVFWI